MPRSHAFCAIVLLASCAPSAPRLSTPLTQDALVAAVAAVVLDSLTQYEREAPVWDIRVTEAGDHGTTLLRAAVLARTRARLRIPSDTAWRHLSIEHFTLDADSAAVMLDRGIRRCTPRSGPWSVGQTSRLVFVRDGAGWRLRSSRASVDYDPPPPPLPGEAAAPCREA